MTTIQAPIGGELHKLTDKFYKGGQFMPDDDRFPAAKRKALRKAAQIGLWCSPSITPGSNGIFPVYVETQTGWRRLVATAKSQEEQIAIRDGLRAVVEKRMGGRPIDWED